MYNNDAYEIAQFAGDSPHGVFNVGLFVLSTIQQHLESVPYMLRDYAQFGLASSQYMRWQKRGISELAYNQTDLHANVVSWQKQGKRARHKALRHMVEYTGFGIVKAAFFVQLVLPDCGVGCLDRHNLKMYGLKASAFSTIPASVAGLTQKLNTYLALCDSLGGSEKLWDRWTTYVAALRPTVFASADEVSKLHVKCILGKYYDEMGDRE